MQRIVYSVSYKRRVANNSTTLFNLKYYARIYIYIFHKSHLSDFIRVINNQMHLDDNCNKLRDTFGPREKERERRGGDYVNA